MVDVATERARGLYAKFGFEPVIDNTDKLFLGIENACDLLVEAGMLSKIDE